jgi:hypothetical protein
MRFRSAVVASAVLLFAASLSASVTGVVTGPSGAPIANARVALFRPIPQMQAFREFRRERKPVPITSAATDKDGRFVLDAGVVGLADVHVIAEGYAPADMIIATDEQTGTIALRLAAMVTGRITANGKPVAGAFVLAIPREGIPESAVTDADGRYRLPDPAVWAQTVFVRHSDFAPAAHLGNALDFVLDAGQSVQGKVVDSNGRPVADSIVDVDDLLTATSGAGGAFTIPHAPKQFGVLRARVEAAVATTRFTSGSPVLRLAPASRISGVVRDAGKRPLSGITVAVVADMNGDMTVTDANGAFAIDRLKPGKYEVIGFGSSRYTMDPTPVEATVGDVKHDIVARRVVPVEGLVRDENQKPVSGAPVVLLMESVQLAGFVSPPGAPTVTATDGRFQLWQELDPSMKVRIAVIKPGFPPVMSDVIDPRKPHAELTIPRGVEIAGVITGPDKKPLSGVSVNPVLGMEPRPGMNAPSLPWATTDDAGHFHGRLTAATKTLTFMRKGYLAAQHLIDVSPAMKPLQVALSAATAIRGHVVNKDGSPAPEVMVMAGEKFTTSGPDGSFVVEEIDAGPMQMRFGRGINGLQEKSITAPADDVKLVLAAMFTIAGHVTDATTGSPVGKFTVTATSKPGDFEMPQPFETASGEFSIDAPEGNISLTVAAEGYASSKGIAVDAASSAPMTIKLSHGRTLRGHVVDEKGQPIAGVRLRAGDAFAREDPEAPAPQTLADGSFELRGISFDEDTDVAFEKSGYVKQGRKLRAGRDDATLEVTLTNGVTVTGHVLGRAGAPSVAVMVAASSAGYGASSGNATTDESGAFRFENLSPARYDFIVERNAAGEHAAVRDVDVTKTRELTIRMEKGATATIFGRVTGLDLTDQSPYNQRYVSVSGVEGESQTAPVDASGNYRLENAPAGVVEIEANSYTRKNSRRSAKTTLELQAGAELRVDLAFPEQVAVRGHVTRGGAPLAGATVIFQAGNNSQTVSGAEGAYQILLDPGAYDVSLSMDDKHLPFAQHVVVKDSSELDLHIDAATLSATVFDAETNEPVSGAKVTLSLRGETHDLATAMTGSDGTASIDVQQGKDLTVIASKVGYANASDNITPSGSAAVTLRLLRTPGAVVRIVDVRDGRTLSGYVIARDAAGRVVASADQTDPDGTVTLPLAAGNYRVSASADGYGSHTVKAVVPSGETRVPLPRGGNLSIRANRAVNGSARLIQPDGEEYVRCWCSGIAAIALEGAITFVDRISPGSYVLEVTLTNNKPHQFPVTVIEGQTTIVPID